MPWTPLGPEIRWCESAPGIAQMKLIGSRAEQQMREELVHSNIALRDGCYGRLTDALKSENVNVADAFVLYWIPEQAEDIYTVLVSKDDVITIEVPRGGGVIQCVRGELNNYEGKCSKVTKLKISVARDLLASRVRERID